MLSLGIISCARRICKRACSSVAGAAVRADAADVAVVKRSPPTLSLLAEFGVAPPQSLMRVDNLLSHAGLCARRDARQFLRACEVIDSTSGTRVLSGRVRVRAAALRLDGKPLPSPAGVPAPGSGSLHLVLHKPAGIVCSHAVGEGESVYDLLPRELNARRPAIQAVGRLDKEASGLLLLTQSGGLNAALCSPSRGVTKEYYVRLEAPLSAAGVEAAALASGSLRLVDGAVAAPAELTPHASDARLARVVLREGRHHQLRRMFAALGHRVTGIHRAGYAGLRLADLGLAPGTWRVLSDEELAAVIAAASAGTTKHAASDPSRAITRRAVSSGGRRTVRASARLRWSNDGDREAD